MQACPNAFDTSAGRLRRLFVGEFITGGGLSGVSMPVALAAEGDMMINALIRDLAEIDGLELSTTRDARLPPLESPVRVTQVQVSGDALDLWGRCIEEANAVWFVAPETGGILERLSRLVLERGRIWVGSSPDAIAVAASKLATARCLARHGIPVVDTMEIGTERPESAHGWVVKPDDGAGCDATYYFPGIGELRAWLGTAPPRGLVVQPYLPGTAASVSLVCRDGAARVLACNEQRIERRGNALVYAGIVVNALRAYRDALESVAARIARALPGLSGYVGVDLILTPDGPVVMEINPRLTTAYVGLSQAIGQNPAKLVLELLLSNERAWPLAETQVAVMLS